MKWMFPLGVVCFFGSIAIGWAQGGFWLALFYWFIAMFFYFGLLAWAGMGWAVKGAKKDANQAAEREAKKDAALEREKEFRDE